MEWQWASLAELFSAYGLAIGFGFLLGAMVVLFNSWRA